MRPILALALCLTLAACSSSTGPDLDDPVPAGKFRFVFDFSTCAKFDSLHIWIRYDKGPFAVDTMLPLPIKTFFDLPADTTYDVTSEWYKDQVSQMGIEWRPFRAVSGGDTTMGVDCR